jgi:Tfp pilus assembly protein PilN
VQTNRPFDLDEYVPLEDEEAPRLLRPVILWLGVLGLTILFIPLYLMANTLGNEVAQLEAELTPLQTALAATPGALPQAQALRVTLTAVHNQTDQVAAILPVLEAEKVDWNAVMLAINQGDDSGIQLTGLEQSGDQLLIRGRAANEDAVTDYAYQLETSGQFNQVMIQSMMAV